MTEQQITPEQAERLRQIFARCVEKMKDVVREFEITQDELHIAGDYLNRLGKSGFSRSLVDMSLALTSADITSPATGTRGNLEGPLHRQGHKLRADGNLIERPLKPGEKRLTLMGIVTDARSGAPLPGAKLDFWQTDGHGDYDREGDHMRGVVVADKDGRYRVHTVVPRDYAEHDHDPIGELLRAMGRPNRRAAHIHVKGFIDGREVLTTQLFIAGSEYLDCDYVEGAVSDDLVLTLESDGEDGFRASFDFALDVGDRA
ncbi:MAG: dioxygenase [Sphingomonadales bacterium]